MPAAEWIWTLACLISLLGIAVWTWHAAGDVRDLGAVPDPQLLHAIARHDVRGAHGANGPQRPALAGQRASADHWQLQV